MDMRRHVPIKYCLKSFIAFQVAILQAVALMSSSQAQADTRVIASKDSAPKTYICKAGGALWNQSRPCNEATPERAEIFKRIKIAPKEQSHDDLSIRLSEQVYQANLAQLWNYPERYAGHEVEVSEIVLSGNMQRTQDARIPEGQRTIATVFDKFGRSLAILVNDGAGHQLVGKLSPNKRYPLSILRLKVARIADGYLPELVNFEISDAKTQYVKANLQERTDPLIPLSPELRSDLKDSEEEQQAAAEGEGSKQNDSEASEATPSFDQEESSPQLNSSDSKEESFPTVSSDLPEESRRKINKLTGAYQKLGSMFDR